jgi:hypothetical protein
VSSASTGKFTFFGRRQFCFFHASNPNLVKKGAGVIMLLTTDRNNANSVENKQRVGIFRNVSDLAIVPEASEWSRKAAHQDHSKTGDRPLESIVRGQRRNRSPRQSGGRSQRERFVLSETGMAAADPWHGER